MHFMSSIYTNHADLAKNTKHFLIKYIMRIYMHMYSNLRGKQEVLWHTNAIFIRQFPNVHTYFPSFFSM